MPTDMKPTKLQFKLLQAYAKFHAKSLTLGGVVRLFWFNWLLILGIIGLGSWLIWAGWPAAGWMYVGVCCGAFLRDVNRIIVLFRTWPMLHEIINWERVNELIESSEKKLGKTDSGRPVV